MMEKKPKRYVMLHGSPSFVQRKANEYMETGWEPYGPPFTSGHDVRVGMYDRAPEVFQAVIRPSNKPGRKVR